MQHVGWRVKGFLAGGGIESVGGEGAQGVEDGLGGRVVADGGADAVALEEVGEAGEVTGARQGWWGLVEGGFSGGNNGGCGAIEDDDVGPACAESFGEGGGVVEEVERAAAVGESGGGGG